MGALRLVLSASASVALLCACAGGTAPQREKKRAVNAAAPVAAEVEESASPRSTRSPVIVEGTGVFAGASGVTPKAVAQAAGDGYQLNFVETDIATVAASVLGDALGLPYSVDPQVKGTMTLQAAYPLVKDDVLPALESALNVYGVALVESGGVYQIVPNKDAPRRVSGLRSAADAGAAGFAIQIVPIKFVSVADMENVLRPLAPEGGILRVDESRNLLLIAGTSRELVAMRDVIATFDVNWLAGMSFGLYPVEYVDAKTIADELETIFGDAKSPIANVVRLIPMSRLNSLMVVTHEASYLKEVESWIKRLDMGVASPGRRIYVYDVQNGKADDLAGSLSKILSIASADAYTTSRDRVSSRSDLNSSFGDSGVSGVGGIANSFSRNDMPLATNRDSPQINSSSSTQYAPGSLKIVPNVENNALLIYATPAEFFVIEGAMKRLDVVPIQVLIEASLAEVSLTDDLRYGLQWAYQGGNGPVVLSEASNGGIAQSFPGFSYLFTGRQDIRAVLNAIETLTNVNVISSPKLLVLNNREAELQIGDQVPITVQSSVSTTGETAPIVNAVQLRDTGVILRITPRVNKSGLVLLDVAQEVSDVVPTTTSSIDSPTIQQRRLSSTVAVRDGETIALGGLIRDSRSRTRGGIPYLRKIPLFGDLFGSTSKNSRRTELIVLITPRVVRSQQESDLMMDDLREQFRGLRKTLPHWSQSNSGLPPNIAPSNGSAPGTPNPAP